MNTATNIWRNDREYHVAWEGRLCIVTDALTGETGTGYSVGAAIRNARGVL